MQSVVIDKPYEFVAPYEGRLWPWLLQRFVGRYLRRQYGVERIDCDGLAKLQDSLAAGHAVLLTPNHCRPSDPLVVTEACRQAGIMPLTMASWHLFMQGRIQRFVLRRIGAFSVYREGLDRKALQAGVDILRDRNRPLVIFPEGVITRTNDRVLALMEGASFIARTAARKLAAESGGGQVVVHPMAIRYHHHGDTEAAVRNTLGAIESRLSWRPRHDSDLVHRIYRVGEALLWLKEIEYLGRPQEGEIPERLQRLLDAILAPIEQERRGGKSETTTVARVKQLRIALLPELMKENLGDDERQRIWGQLEDMYTAQQMSHYPPYYVRSNPTPERMLETVERFEEDLTDRCQIHRPLSASVRVGDAIPVSPERIRGASEDPLISEVDRQLHELLGIPMTRDAAGSQDVARSGRAATEEQAASGATKPVAKRFGEG